MRAKYSVLGPGSRKNLSVIESHTPRILFNVLSKTYKAIQICDNYNTKLFFKIGKRVIQKTKKRWIRIKYKLLA